MRNGSTFCYRKRGFSQFCDWGKSAKDKTVIMFFLFFSPDWAEAKNDSEISDYIKQAAKTLAVYFSEDPAFDSLLEFDALGEIYSRIKSNAYAIQGPMNEPMGHGVFLSAAKFDHSCKPNACQSYDGPDMLVHAITDLPAVENVSPIFLF